MSSSRIRFSLFAAAIAIALTVANSAHAAPVVWYIDTQATSLGVRSTGSTTISSAVVGLKMIAQGVTPGLGSITPTITMKLGGQFTTDTDFSSSIQFLSGSGVQALPVFNAQPLPFSGDIGKAPADYAGTVIAKVGPISQSTVDVALRNSFYDLSSAPLSVSGGSFAASGTSFGIADGRFDYRGYAIGASLGSGNLAVTPASVSNTSGANGTLTGSGAAATLTFPVTATITQTIAQGPDGSPAFVMTFFYSGTIVAHTYAVPEPSTLCLAGAGIGLVAGESYRRRRARLRGSAHAMSEPGT